MEVNQFNLRCLLKETDKAFEMAMQHPTSAAHEAKYELAKLALEDYLLTMRQSLHKKTKSP
tara:strand:+ start:1097 stop:1279 length:183 start_codon:yes stop_codon:yes gene_type:complete